MDCMRGVDGRTVWIARVGLRCLQATGGSSLSGFVGFRIAEPGCARSPQLVLRRTKLARNACGTRSPRPAPRSFSEAELAENGVQEIVDGGLAHHLAQGGQRHPEFEGHQLQRLVLLEA